jgi:hypothetical protein
MSIDRRALPIKVDEACKPGTWCSTTIILDGVKPNNLGVLGVTRFSIACLYAVSRRRFLWSD